VIEEEEEPILDQSRDDSMLGTDDAAEKDDSDSEDERVID
jgi:hypothetical protein